MRRWRKILLMGACVIAALIAGAWLLWNAWSTKPIMVRLPDQTTLALYATSHGTNQSTFPEPNPLKRLLQLAQRTKPVVTRVRLTSIQPFDDKTAYWWFKVNPPLPPNSGLMSWHTTIHTTSHEPFVTSRSGFMRRTTRPGLVGLYLQDCPTNTPTMVITFVTYKTVVTAGESRFGDILTNMTVPNPMYRP